MTLAKRFTVTPAWKGGTAIIIGGGPSFDLAQNRQIARARHGVSSPFRVMAINDAVYGAWWADWLHSCDSQWWYQHIQGVHTFPGTKTCTQDDTPAPWVDGYLHETGFDGFDEDPSCIRTGGNSAYQGMHIAIHLGVKRIILCGIDMNVGPNGEKHWFGDHDGVMGYAVPNFARDMAPHFETLKPALEARGIEVLNTSAQSALTAFPKMELERALKL